MLGTLMPMKKRYPGTVSRLENEFERFMNPFDRFFNQEDWEMVSQQVFPRANVVETDNLFEVTVELPGMDAKEVMVEFQDGALWISGEKKEEKEEKGRMFHRIERAYGKFQRKIDLPGVVKDAEINAEYVNGVLKVVVPKSEEVKPKQIKIKTR
jgi:HSP20 family protein